VNNTPIIGGVAGRVLFQGTGDVLQQSSSLFWDSTNNRLGIGTSTPSVDVDIVKTIDSTFEGLNVRNLSTGTNATTVIRVKDNAGNICEFGLGGTNHTSLPNIGYFYTNKQILAFYANASERMRLSPNGNVLINTTTDAGFRLDVNGTARVQNDLSVSRNQNNPTKIAVSNTTAGNNSFVEGGYASDSSSGECKIGKYSSTTSAYKIITASNAYLYNGTIAGDIAILNDFATGRIKFATGGVSTAQMTLFSTGNLGINTTTDAGFKLDVNGTARVATSILVGSSSTQGTIQTGVFRGTFFNDYANNFTIFQVQTSGNVSFYNSVAIGTTSAPSASKLRVVGLPTSSAGLSSGDVWNDGGTLKIV
jgi:hypothetical protein